MAIRRWRCASWPASPKTGAVVRVHLHAPHEKTDRPKALGDMAAAMLLDSGADRLLAALTEEGAGGAA